LFLWGHFINLAASSRAGGSMSSSRATRREPGRCHRRQFDATVSTRIQHTNAIGRVITTAAVHPHPRRTGSPRFGGGHTTTTESYKVHT
jgi:hypothetical protein